MRDINQTARIVEEREDIIGIVCPKCGYLSYFSKLEICGCRGTVFLGKAEDRKDALLLFCTKNECKNEMVVHVNCKGFK